MSRLSYDASIGALRERGILAADEAPVMPDRMPQPDDEAPLGFSLFRSALEDADLSNLSLPRTFICRSEVAGTTLRHSDLTESFLCWSDFTDVDLSEAVLVAADLRAAVFERASFAGADLSGADLRRSSFVDCSFAGAVLVGARLTRLESQALKLSAEQVAVIDWQEAQGPEPPGG